ncbi:MAG: glycoside hydrolase family 127 protein, partial [Anaerolineae bacterium]|nr:glycoside hydrolase family 127 protein [Anaerolineae bacterium]
ASLAVNGEPLAQPRHAGSYVELRRVWQAGDVVRLHLPMPARRMASHPYALENTGRVALMRGPLLYCIEGADHPGIDLRDVVLPAAAAVSAVERNDLLGGVVTLTAAGLVRPPAAAWADQLYRPAVAGEPRSGGQPITITAIPYYAWANRAAGPMQVWLQSD